MADRENGKDDEADLFRIPKGLFRSVRHQPIEKYGRRKFEKRIIKINKSFGSNS